MDRLRRDRARSLEEQVSFVAYQSTNRTPAQIADLLVIDCGNNGYGTMVRAQNPTLEHNILTFTGRLAPGSHIFEVVVAAAETSVASSPDSLRLQQSLNTSAVDINPLSRCGSVTTFRNRPTAPYDAVFGFEVMLGATATVC